MRPEHVDPVLHHFDGVFVGGSTKWKPRTAFYWVQFAHMRDLPCHIGRISGRRRTRWAKSIGADSIDSCVPLWSADNRRNMLEGLTDPVELVIPPSFEEAA